MMEKSPTGRLTRSEPNTQTITPRPPEAKAVKDALVKKVRAGHDFPCALHRGPAGDCNEHNCRCT